MGPEIGNEVRDPTTRDKGMVRVVVIIALELLAMPVGIAWHPTDLHHK